MICGSHRRDQTLELASRTGVSCWHCALYHTVHCRDRYLSIGSYYFVLLRTTPYFSTWHTKNDSFEISRPVMACSVNLRSIRMGRRAAAILLTDSRHEPFTQEMPLAGSGQVREHYPILRRTLQ